MLGDALEPRFMELVEKAKSNIPEHDNGRRIYEKFVKPSMVDLAAVGAHYAMRSLFRESPEQTSLYCFSLREAARGAFAPAMPPGTERGLVLAMVLGDRSEVDEPTAEAFRSSGTYHVLALSGAQVALVAGLLVAGLRWLRVGPWGQAAVTGLVVGLYALFVGGDVPVVRAALMASAVLAGRALEVDTDASNLLGLAGLALLALRPAAAADVGFQLSFGATLAILLLTSPLALGVPRLPLAVGLSGLSTASAVTSPAVIFIFLSMVCMGSELWSL